MTLERSLPLETLLAEADHVTALARALVTDAATADDVAQSTWLDVLRSERRRIVDPRAWLATIVRRRASRTRRTEARRSRHERIAADARADGVAPSAAELAVRVATHRALVDAVLALGEPYRETIVLRFFENLDVDAIALRMQTKRNTVRSRVQRGLDALRERLDRAHGGREHWLPAVSALGARQMAVETAAIGSGLVGGIAFAITMKKLAVAILAVAIAVLFALPVLMPPAESIAPEPDAAAPIASGATEVPTSRNEGSTSAIDAPSPTNESSARRTAPATIAVAEPEPGRRRLVDREQKGLEGVLMRAAAPTTVRWQGGDRGWIGGAGHTIRILGDEEDRLLRDPRYAEDFFAKVPTPAEWRATILGEAIPARDTRTDRDGWFVFPRSLSVDDDAVEIADARHVLITAGRGSDEPWVAGPAVRVEGSVHDANGQPIADAFAIPVCPTENGPVELHAQLATRTDDQGAFLVRRALANGEVRVSCEGYVTRSVPLTQDLVQRPYIVLDRPGFAAMRTITGTVTALGGAPIANASVWFGRQQTKTAADGRFTLAADDAKPQYALTILAKGWAALQQPDFGAKLLTGGPTQNLLFVLEKQPKRIRGVVRKGDGTPIEGALVFLVDPTLLDISFDTVESRVGESPGVVRSDAQGAFVLDGLDDRKYRVRAVDPSTGASTTSKPHAPDAGDLDLRLRGPVAAIMGRVVDAGGAPVPNATVEIAFFTHVTKGGGTQMQSTPAVPCDRQGRFTLRGGFDADAWLCVRVDGKVRQLVPTLPHGGKSLDVVCDGSRWLRLLHDPSRDVRTVHFQLPDGSLAKASGDHFWSNQAIPIPKGAVAVILDKETKRMVRLELTDDLAVHLRVP